MEKIQMTTPLVEMDTGGLCDCTTKKHRAGYITLALRLTANCLQSLRNCITFTNTRSDTCNQSTSGTNCTTCQCDTTRE